MISPRDYSKGSFHRILRIPLKNPTRIPSDIVTGTPGFHTKISNVILPEIPLDFQELFRILLL